MSVSLSFERKVFAVSVVEIVVAGLYWHSHHKMMPQASSVVAISTVLLAVVVLHLVAPADWLVHFMAVLSALSVVLVIGHLIAILPRTAPGAWALAHPIFAVIGIFAFSMLLSAVLHELLNRGQHGQRLYTEM